MKTLTILTPTYNRSDCLPKLYHSLKNQNNRDFLWMIVDDGSKDKTEALVQNWMKEGEVSIRWIRKENGGKHTALNAGIARIQTELTFIVDSDDWLPEDAVSTILHYYRLYPGDNALCGYSFLRFYPDGRVNEAFFPKEEERSTYVNVRINGGIGGDKAEVFFTEILKRYPFPVFEGEKFLPEDLVWVQMSGPYEMIHINRCIYISDYLEGGLTRSGKRMKLKSPRGMMARSCVYLKDPAVNLKTKLKMALLYNVYRQAAKPLTKQEKEEGRKYGLAVACRLPGWAIFQLWKRKYGPKGV